MFIYSANINKICAASDPRYLSSLSEMIFYSADFASVNDITTFSECSDAHVSDTR